MIGRAARLLRRLKGRHAGQAPSDAELLTRSDLFDPGWYVERHPDARVGAVEPAEHYLKAGHPRGASTSEAFDGRLYLEMNPDVAAAGVDPLLHYLRHGRAEGRSLPRPRSAVLTAGPPTLEPPHHGRVIEALIAPPTRDARTVSGEDEGRSEIEGALDRAYYLLRYRQLAKAQSFDAAGHYARAGAREGRDPSADFSTEQYLRRHPDVASSGLNPLLHWVQEGRAQGRIASPIRDFEAMARIVGIAPACAQEEIAARRADLRERLASGTLGRMVAEAARLDPLVARSWTEMARIKMPPFHGDAMVSRIVALHRLQSDAGFARARHVIAVNRPRWGGGRRMEGHLAHALAEMAGAGEVLVITTEESGVMPEGKLPDGVRHVRFADAAEGLRSDVREKLLAEFLRSLRPGTVFNVNSRLMWDVLGAHGRALSSSMRIVAGLFCDEQTPLGFRGGYPVERFYRTFDYLAAVCPDSHALAGELRERYMVPPSRAEAIAVLEAPVDLSIRVAERPPALPTRRPQVFWSGRLDRQKRPDIAHAVARAMPEIDLRMWGSAVMDGIPRAAPPNVSHLSPYARFEDLPLGEADLWLYTAEWDGVPSVLLEVAMTGLPIVGSRVGGTGEVLRDGLSEPVDAFEDVEAYCEAIRRVLADPGGARARALELRDALAAHRTPEAYRATLRRVIGGPPAPAPTSTPATLPASAAASGGIDLSVAVLLHSESVAAGPTFRSLEAAIARVEATGRTVERLIGLDAPTPECRAFAAQPDLSAWRASEHDLRDQGLARNALARGARGRWLAFMDGDDLCSANWLAEAVEVMEAAEAAGERVIAHPELGWQFDGAASVYTTLAQDDPLFTPHYLSTANLYDALCVAPRAAWTEIPYSARDLETGFAFEDWDWAVRTMAAGWIHRVARDTVIFKRRRDRSQSRDSKASRALVRPLELLAIDEIAKLGRGAP